MKRISPIQILFLVVFCLPLSLRAQNIGINTDGSDPDGSALLDIKSTDGGLLIPRMNQAARNNIATVCSCTPETGLLIYQTDNTPGFYYYNGASWSLVFNSDVNWGTTGNAGTTVATNYLGTSDTKDLVIKSNDEEKVRVNTLGYVGIGDASPEELLSVGTDSEFQVDSTGKIAKIAGGMVSPWTQIVYVDSNGQGDYTTLAAALSGISPTSTNPYSIIVGEGDFNSGWGGEATLKSYVTIIGSGAGTEVGPLIGTGLVDVKISNLYYNVDANPSSTKDLSGEVTFENCEVNVDNTSAANYYDIASGVTFRNCYFNSVIDIQGDFHAVHCRFEDMVDVGNSTHQSAPQFHQCLFEGDIDGNQTDPDFYNCIILGEYNIPYSFSNTGYLYNCYIADVEGDNDGSDVIYMYNCYIDDFNPSAANVNSFNFYNSIIKTYTGAVGASYTVNLYNSEIVSSSGVTTVINNVVAPGGFGVKAGAAGVVPMIVQADASQTANIQEWQNSAGTALTVIDEAGKLGVLNNNPTYDLDVTGDINVTGAIRASGSLGSYGQALLSTGAGLTFGSIHAKANGPYWDIDGNAGTTAGTDYIGTSDAVDFVLKANNKEAIRIASGGNVGIGVTSPSSELEVNGIITNPGGTYSEKYGADAVASGTYDIVFGNAASATNNNVLAIGASASSSSSQGFALGKSASSTGIRGVTIGASSSSTSSDNICIGGSSTLAQNSVLLGYSATGTSSSIAIGRDASATGTATAIGRDATATSGYFVAGSGSYPINNVVFGKGISHATPTAYTIEGTKGTGSNITGGNLRFGAGPGTGSGNSGSIVFQTASAGGSGSSENALATRMSIDTDGDVKVGTGSPSARLDVGSSFGVAMSAVKTGAYTITDTDFIVQGDVSGGGFTLTLPTAASINGRVYIIKKTDNSGNTLTVSGSGAETIDGSGSVSLSAAYESMTIQSDGTNWIRIK